MKIQGDRVNDSALPDALSGPQRPRLQALLDFSPDVICSLDKEGHFIDVSAAAKTLWGYDPEELRGRHFIEFVLEEDRQRTLQAAEGVLQGVVSSDFENCFRCKDGSIRRNIWSASWNPRDEMVYCIARDGSERYKARQKAAQYEARLYEAYKLAGIGWWELNLPENELSVSDELYQIYGISRVQYPVFTTDVFLSLVHPDDLAHVQESLQAVQEVPYHQYDHRIVKPSGEVIYVIHYTHTVKDESGRVVKIHGTTKDISQRKGYEAALRRSQQKLEDIVESLGDGFYALDRAWTITYWNGRAERVTGKKREEVLGKNFWDVYPKAKMLRFYEEFDKALATNRPVHFEEFSPSLQAWMDVSAYPSQEGLSIYIKEIGRAHV